MHTPLSRHCSTLLLLLLTACSSSQKGNGGGPDAQAAGGAGRAASTGGSNDGSAMGSGGMAGTGPDALFGSDSTPKVELADGPTDTSGSGGADAEVTEVADAGKDTPSDPGVASPSDLPRIPTDGAAAPNLDGGNLGIPDLAPDRIAADGNLGDLLGRQFRWPGHATRPDLHPDKRGRPAHLWPGDGRATLVLGPVRPSAAVAEPRTQTFS
jgi:hypothetical protein